ncbi:dynein light chain Tctex-type protein 2B-like [Armigeres subalbatus]|uniref:dynein light chain Tctex-type protein 2B-like n=1 Tax=Armigeres subalbatus TaxID=124917 RepID=UPI002ED56F9D
MASNQKPQKIIQKRHRKIRISIKEPHEELGTDRTRESKSHQRSFRASTNLTPNSILRRPSSRSGMLGSFLGPTGLPSMPSTQWTSARRTTMYMAPRFQNNYRLESRRPFNRDRVQLMVARYLGTFLAEHRYNPKRAKRLAENLCFELRNLIKRCHFDRYRVVAMVTVGDKQSQDFRSVLRFVWDAEKDGYVNFAHETPDFFVIATVFAVYFE